MTSLSDIGKNVAKFAPLLGGVVAGPAGAAIGSILASKFGGKPDDLDDLSTRIITDPDAAVKLKQIEADHEEKLQELAIQAESNRLSAETNQLKIQADIVASAQAMNTANSGEKQKITDEITKMYLVLFNSCLIIACLCFIYYRKAAGEEISIITLVLGNAMGDLKGYNTFFYGSSIGSRAKDFLISKLKSRKYKIDND